ncbi:MAG: S-layer homology domain-containing protein [Oscillospiraceae bacterium]|nr:S-layer homology domain-containing protein [Oscillospiraceae bacterium]
MKSIVRHVVLLLLCGLICLPAMAAEGETLYNQEYCFAEEDFDKEAGGIFVRSVPDSSVGTFYLGSRSICPGDVISVDRLSELRMVPNCRENCQAILCYSPIMGNSLGKDVQLVVKIRSGKNEVPKVEDLELETYKNIANNGKLTAVDPEGSVLEFALAEMPRYGKVDLKPDGSFLYIPEKNKVGEDSFTFTAKDEAGNVSQPGTVKVTILKPSGTKTFADMDGDPEAFEAMWASQLNLTGGMEIAGRTCFCPEATVTRGEFLVMVMELTKQPVDESLTTSAFTDGEEAAPWLRPYIAAGVRKGIIRGEIREEGLVFRPNDPIKGREAAVILQNLLQLPVSAVGRENAEPVWSAASVQAMGEAGFSMVPGKALTREEVVCILYSLSKR